jgi:hypothetical protein
MKKTMLYVAMISALTSFNVQAENDGAPCGVGSTVYKGDSGKSAHFTAAFIDYIINFIGVPTTPISMTFGVMGCDTSTTVKLHQEKEIFVAMNFDNLSQDIAKGEGNYLVSYAQILGVSTEDLSTFNQLSQEQYLALLDSDDASAIELVKQMDNAMMSHPILEKYTH